jgi:hypothetical protein
MADYFEIDRVIEDLAKIYSTAFAVSLLKVNNNKKPTKEEFRGLVTSFMLDFEKSLSRFPETKEGINFKNYSKDLLEKQIQFVLDGQNKEVEKRYRYYVEYS